MRVGIIGYGTVGTVLGNILNINHVQFGVYDIIFNDYLNNKSSKDIANLNDDIIVKNLASLIETSDLIVSTVTTTEAENIAKECLPHLNKAQIYIDLNSVSSQVKKRISVFLEPGQVYFVEGAILNSVKKGSTTFDVLLTGAKGKEIEHFFKEIGINARFYSDKIGNASDFKMIRSIFSKGLETLLIETLMTAHKAGIQEDLWDEIVKYMDSKSFNEIAETWVTSHVISYERRFHEMKQVIRTMRDFGIKPILSASTFDFFERSMAMNLKEAFPYPSDSIQTTIEKFSDVLSKHSK